jgi:hypothetical protein
LLVFPTRVIHVLTAVITAKGVNTMNTPNIETDATAQAVAPAEEPSHNELGAWGIPDGGVFTGLPIPRGVLLPHEPAGLMLKPI